MTEPFTATSFDDELASLRHQIDGFDQQLIAILKDRTAIVRKVGALKRNHAPGLCPIRAAREAQQLRAIATAFAQGDFPAPAAMAIWRLIISASLSVESDLKLSVYASADDASCALLAGEYFGHFLPTQRQNTARRVIADVMDGKASVGILPAPRMDDPAPWWPDLALMAKDGKAPLIFARLPLALTARSAQQPQALAIAKVAPEPSGDDVSYLALSMDESLSTHRLQTALAAAKIEASWAGAVNKTGGQRELLVEMKGYHTPETEALKNMLATLSTGLRSAAFLGSCAAPLVVATPATSHS